ncbi:MAG: hypothetical protein EOP84_14535 [Verrucomicrobiaceae bacterium]|nr:MAG: hypothetical protein EOP84_14535 [Verrucomicrobiaceae bacterium]
MAISSGERLRIALNRDLKKTGSVGLSKVVNDSRRKTFTVNKDGAVLEFAHKQPDGEFWSGIKYYGSGTRSRIRIRRTPEEVKEVKVAAVAVVA